MAKKEFTATEVMATLERMEKNFRVFSEGQNALKNRVDAMFEMVEKNAEDIDLLKSLARTSTADITVIKFETVVIQKRLNEMQKQLIYKADRDDYNKIGKRLLVLEKKLKIV